MKAPNPAPFRPSAAAATCLLAALYFAGSPAYSAPVQSDGAKTYTLFEGVNVAVGQGSDLHYVRDISGASWVVAVNGKETLVPTDKGPLSMRVTTQLKLTEASAELTNVTGERAYTYANDPSVKLTKQMNQFAELNVASHAAVNQAQSDANGSIQAASQMGNNTSTGLNHAGPASSMNAAGSAAAKEDSASAAAGPTLFSDGSSGDSGSFDALDVSFEISAPKQLGTPFIIVITKFHDRSAAPGAVGQLVYAKELMPVEAKPTRVKFEQAGFPFGYELKSCEIHVYNQGMEVATNVAKNRKVLTSEQAFEYVRAMYLDSHKGKTVPAAPVMGNLPDDLASRLSAGKYGVPFYVKVSKEGLPLGAYSDSACTSKIDDPYLDSVIQGIRFKPALDKGEPVEGTSSLNLSQLRI